MIARVGIVLAVLTVLVASARALADEPTSTPAVEPSAGPLRLFDSGRDGYKRYRIPSLVVTPSGAVLAICEGRRDGRGLTGDIDLVFRRSRDSGRTWSALKILADDGAETLGNPCAVVDRVRKRLWVAFTRSKGSDTEDAIVAGTSDESTRVFVTSTTDDGDTWTKPVDITAACKDDRWTWYGTGPGVGIQMRKTGRIVVPSYHAEAGTRVYRSHMIYSDDHGATWKRGAVVGQHASECHVVERRDGSLAWNARTVEGPERRQIALSDDGGETWSKATHDDSLYDSHCEACLIDATTAGGAPLWLFSHPAGPGRRDLTLRLSRDEGKNWKAVRTLRTGDAQYSCLAILPDGAVGCLDDFWADGNYQLSFQRVSLSP